MNDTEMRESSIDDSHPDVASISRWIILSGLTVFILIFFILVIYQHSIMIKDMKYSSSMIERNYDLLMSRTDIINAIARDVSTLKANVDAIRKEHDAQDKRLENTSSANDHGQQQ